MKRLLSVALMVCLIFCIALSVNALSINVPEEVPANSDFGFSITLPSTDSFTHTEIYFDNVLILTAYTNGKFTINPFNGKFVLNAFTFDENPNSNEGLTLYVSYFSIPAGEYEIRAISYNNSVQSNEESKSFNSVKIESKELENKVQEISNQLTEINSSLGNVKTEAINAAQEKVNELKNDLQNYSTKEELNAKLDEISSELTKLKSQITELKKQALLEEEQKQASPFNSTGFANFTQSNKVWIILLIGIIFVAIAFINTKRKGGCLLSFSRGYSFENQKKLKKQWPQKLTPREAVGEAMEDKERIPQEESVHFGDILRK